jgi:hypothetical protein
MVQGEGSVNSSTVGTPDLFRFSVAEERRE